MAPRWNAGRMHPAGRWLVILSAAIATVLAVLLPLMAVLALAGPAAGGSGYVSGSGLGPVRPYGGVTLAPDSRSTLDLIIGEEWIAPTGGRWCGRSRQFLDVAL
jgi:hypothetical protein